MILAFYDHEGSCLIVDKKKKSRKAANKKLSQDLSSHASKNENPLPDHTFLADQRRPINAHELQFRQSKLLTVSTSKEQERKYSKSKVNKQRDKESCRPRFAIDKVQLSLANSRLHRSLFSGLRSKHVLLNVYCAHLKCHTSESVQSQDWSAESVDRDGAKNSCKAETLKKDSYFTYLDLTIPTMSCD